MKDVRFKILSNREIASSVYELDLAGDASSITNSGQFVNIKVDGLFLRRPISICDYSDETLKLIYKVVGEGTKKISEIEAGDFLSALLPLGNGFDSSYAGANPLLVGGGVGVPPLYLLAKNLLEQAQYNTVINTVSVVLGFNSSEDIFYLDEFEKLGCDVYLTTVDGSNGKKGFVTDVLDKIDYSYVYACGPEAMLKALSENIKTSGQFSFEARMACGFGACMGCTKKVKGSYKRICKDGPVLFKEEILW